MNNLPNIKRKSGNVHSFLAFLLFICFSFTSYYIQAQEMKSITLNVQNETAENVFNQLGMQTGLKFFYDQEIVNAAPRITLKVSNVSLQDVLERITLQTKLYFNRDNHTISVGKQKIGQDTSKDIKLRNLKGRVVDQNGEPIIGASVLIKGTANGTITDIDGKFILKDAKKGNTLVVSYVGYLTQDILLNGNQGTLSIEMEENTETVKEPQYLMQNLCNQIKQLTKKNLSSDGGKILEAAKRNDVLYGIPSGNAERIPSQFLWIRKDWLDKLGLDVPKTLDDVVEVARAFKNDDPDGNGVDDTWGLGVCNEMSDYAGYGTIEGVVNAFGGSILQYMWMPNDDGTVSYEPTSQETRNALEKLAAMYSEGLINEEFGVSDTDAISEAVAAGTCGLFYGTDGISWGAGRDAIANNNDCGWMVINAPSVEGGDATAYSYTNFDYVYAVNANCEHPEALIKLIN